MTDPSQLPLRDIHLPGTVPFWPPAPGWWILTALLLIGTIGGWWWYRRHVQFKRSAARLARIELQQIVNRYESDKNSLELVRQLSVLVRRLSISLFPRTEVASLTGQAWLEFLQRESKLEQFRDDTGRLLAEAPYRREVTEAEAETALGLCRTWIDTIAKVKPR